MTIEHVRGIIFLKEKKHKVTLTFIMYVCCQVQSFSNCSLSTGLGDRGNHST